MSKARNNARGKDCSLRLSCCNYNPETTVLAHLRMFSNAGMGQKPDDMLAVFACSNCHDALDRRSSCEWDYSDVLRALMETLIEQKRDGVIK